MLGLLLLSYFLVVLLLTIIIIIEYNDTLSTISLIPEINDSKTSRRETGQLQVAAPIQCWTLLKVHTLKKKEEEDLRMSIRGQQTCTLSPELCVRRGGGGGGEGDGGRPDSIRR